MATREAVARQKRRDGRPHNGKGHTFIGVPVAHCYEEGCTESRTWGPPITPTHPFTQIGGGAVWYSRQMGEDEAPEAGMGRYADEGASEPL